MFRHPFRLTPVDIFPGAARAAGALAVLVALLAVPTAAFAQRTTATYPESESLLDWRSRSGFDVLKTRMAGRDLQLPRIHGLVLSYGTVGVPSQDATRISFPVHVSDLRPMSAATVRQRGAAGWSGGDTLFVVLEHEHRISEPLKSVEERLRLQLNHTPDTSKSKTLRRYVRQPREEWFYNVSSDGVVEFIARCTDGYQNNLCDGLFSIPQDISVHYTFSKDRIESWRTLDRDVKLLVGSLFADQESPACVSARPDPRPAPARCA